MEATTPSSNEVLELELTIIRGDGFAAKDVYMFRKPTSDPYVEIWLCPAGPVEGDDNKFLIAKTMPKMKTLEPRWDETFTTSHYADEFTEFAVFELKIWDYDKYSDDDPMGVVLVKIPHGIYETTTKWYRVPANSLGEDEATGRVECTLRTKKRRLEPGEEPKCFGEPLVPDILLNSQNFRTRDYFQSAKKVGKRVGRNVLKKKRKKNKNDTSSGPKEDQVEVDLTIVRARKLTPMDTNLLGFKAKSDPYIVVRMCPQGVAQGCNKIYVGKTPTLFKTLNPVWKEHNRFSITLPRLQLNRHAMFELTLWDYDQGSEDDIMGVVHVPVNVNRPPGETIRWYKVPPHSAGNVEATGDVECILNIKTGGRPTSGVYQEESGLYQDETLDVAASLQKRFKTPRRRSTAKGATGPKRVEVMELELNVVKARGLAAMDSNKVGLRLSSDPYIICKLCPEGPSQPDDTKIELGQTDIDFKTLDPMWNTTFKTSLLKKDMTQFAAFELSIWDYDDDNEDDLMGKVFVHIPTGKSGTTEKWYEVPASSAEGGRGKGEVQCVLTTNKFQRLEGPASPEDGSLLGQRPTYLSDADSQDDDDESEDEDGNAPPTPLVSVDGVDTEERKEDEEDDEDKLLTAAERIARNRKIRQFNRPDGKPIGERKARRELKSNTDILKNRTIKKPDRKVRPAPAKPTKRQEKKKPKKKRPPRTKKGGSKQGSSSSLDVEDPIDVGSDIDVDIDFEVDIDEENYEPTNVTSDSESGSVQGFSALDIDIDEETPADLGEDDVPSEAAINNISEKDSAGEDDIPAEASKAVSESTSTHKKDSLAKAKGERKKNTNRVHTSGSVKREETTTKTKGNQTKKGPKKEPAGKKGVKASASKYSKDGSSSETDEGSSKDDKKKGARSGWGDHVDELRGSIMARSSPTRSVQSTDDDDSSESEGESEEADDDDDDEEDSIQEVIQQRLKICSIYEKWTDLKKNKARVDKEKASITAKMMPFAGFVV